MSASVGFSDTTLHTAIGLYRRPISVITVFRSPQWGATAEERIGERSREVRIEEPTMQNLKLAPPDQRTHPTV